VSGAGVESALETGGADAALEGAAAGAAAALSAALALALALATAGRLAVVAGLVGAALVALVVLEAAAGVALDNSGGSLIGRMGNVAPGAGRGGAVLGEPTSAANAPQAPPTAMAI